MKSLNSFRLAVKSGAKFSRSFTKVIDHLPQYLSITNLLSLSVDDVLKEVAKRCKLQHDHLCMYPETRPLNILRSLYLDSVKNIKLFQGTHPSEKKQALDRLLKSQFESLDARHGMVTETLADALLSLGRIEEEMNEGDVTITKPHEIMQMSFQSILHRQASISVLLQHGIGLTSSQHFCSTGCVIESDIMTLCTGVKNQAMTLANHQFNWSPEILIKLINNKSDDTVCKKTCGIICIPSFARFVLLETFKNALHATAEAYLTKHPHILKMSSSSDFDESAIDFDVPVVHVTIISSKESIEIRIEDEGYGMTAEELEKASGFMWASTIKPSAMVDEQMSYQPMSEPLKGLGVGLCLSTVYATHFGGSLQLESRGRNQGTTVTFTIPRDITVVEKH